MKTGNLKPEAKQALLNSIQKELDTRDKRFMFLKLSFPSLLPLIQLEGNNITTSYNIYTQFEKSCMLGSLMACMNSYLDCNLYLDLD